MPSQHSASIEATQTARHAILRSLYPGFDDLPLHQQEAAWHALLATEQALRDAGFTLRLTPTTPASDPSQP